MKQNDAKMMKIDIVNFGEKNQEAKENSEITDKFQKELIAERMSDNAPAISRNEYQPGDLVLYDSLHNEKSRKTAKLDSRYKGPYKVLRQVKDEIKGRHLVLGAIKFYFFY